MRAKPSLLGKDEVASSNLASSSKSPSSSDGLFNINHEFSQKSCHFETGERPEMTAKLLRDDIGMWKMPVPAGDYFMTSSPSTQSTVTVLPVVTSPRRSFLLSMVSTVCCTYRRRGRAPNSGS